ncbi:hypothetical protein Tco_1313878 [Tanacetum coccineum]
MSTPEGEDNSLFLFPSFESFHVDYAPIGKSTIDVVEDIPVDVPNILPNHPTLHMDFDSFPSHKILDPIWKFQKTLANSFRFPRDWIPLLPFSSENEDKVFNHGVLASKEKYPPSSSHRDFKASKLFHHKSPMLIHGEDIPILDVSYQISTKGQKQSQKRQNRARNWKEHEKVKVKVK